MFTGLIVERGLITEAEADSAGVGKRLQIRMSEELGLALEIGASLAVSGCCLTVTEISRCEAGAANSEPGCSVAVELSPETLTRTTLSEVAVGTFVNLEPALAMGQSLGGHLVQGHVDCSTELLAREEHDEFSTFWWALPKQHRPFLVEKGSVTMDGVSLTVAALEQERFSVALIPHTLEVTTLGALKPGSRSNLEVDVLGKYVEQAISTRLSAIEQRLAALES